MRLLVALRCAQAPQRMSLDLATLSRTALHSHLGRTLSRATTAHKHLAAVGALPPTLSDGTPDAHNSPAHEPASPSAPGAGAKQQVPQHDALVQHLDPLNGADAVDYLHRMAAVARAGGEPRGIFTCSEGSATEERRSRAGVNAGPALRA